MKRTYDIASMVNIAEQNEMEIDTRSDCMLVRHNKTGGYWKIVRTVEDIKAILA